LPKLPRSSALLRRADLRRYAAHPIVYLYHRWAPHSPVHDVRRPSSIGAPLSGTTIPQRCGGPRRSQQQRPLRNARLAPVCDAEGACASIPQSLSARCRWSTLAPAADRVVWSADALTACFRVASSLLVVNPNGRDGWSYDRWFAVGMRKIKRAALIHRSPVACFPSRVVCCSLACCHPG
jgi:hypothetical protein